MISVARSPLASPALRPMSSAYATKSFPFQLAGTPSSPLSRPAYSPLPQAHVSSQGTPRDPRLNGSALGYFNLGHTSSTSYQSGAPCSSNIRAPSPVSTPPILSNDQASLSSLEHGIERPSSILSLNNDSLPPATILARRLKPTFKLAVPRPSCVREESFESLALAGMAFAMFSPDTPGELTWSDSFDSVATLKPVRGRVLTPYPRIDESEWVDDVDEAIQNEGDQ